MYLLLKNDMRVRIFVMGQNAGLNIHWLCVFSLYHILEVVVDLKVDPLLLAITMLERIYSM